MSNRTAPTIVVLGAGAIGSYFGGRLARAGQSVTLIGRRDHVDAINRDGLLVSERRYRGAHCGYRNDRHCRGGRRGTALFCVKNLTPRMRQQTGAASSATYAVIVSLQNGVDNAERIHRHCKNQVVLVLIYIGANIPAPGHVRHTGGGNVIIGQVGRGGGDPSSDLLGGIAALFTNARNFREYRREHRDRSRIKLVMNCAYNAICALCGAPYGRMVALAEIAGVMRDVVAELVAVARAKGVSCPATLPRPPSSSPTPCRRPCHRRRRTSPREGGPKSIISMAMSPARARRWASRCRSIARSPR